MKRTYLVSRSSYLANKNEARIAYLVQRISSAPAPDPTRYEQRGTRYEQRGTRYEQRGTRYEQRGTSDTNGTGEKLQRPGSLAARQGYRAERVQADPAISKGGNLRFGFSNSPGCGVRSIQCRRRLQPISQQGVSAISFCR